MVETNIIQIKRQLVTVCKILENEKVTDELGHVSARIPNSNHVLINGRVSPGKATIEDITTVDLDGRQVDGSLQAPGETPLHLSIYKKRQNVSTRGMR